MEKERLVVSYPLMPCFLTRASLPLRPAAGGAAVSIFSSYFLLTNIKPKHSFFKPFSMHPSDSNPTVIQSNFNKNSFNKHYFCCMGKPTFSGVGVTALNGKVGNDIFTRNAYGPITRRSSGTPAGSTYLDSWRVLYQSVHDRWMLITDGQREQWIKLTDSELRRQSSRKHAGNVPRNHVLTGFHYFMQVNLNRSIIGESILDDAPVLKPIGYTSNFQCAYNVGTDTVDFSFDYVCPVATSIILYSTFPKSIGRMSYTWSYSFFNMLAIGLSGSGTYFGSIYTGAPSFFNNSWAGRFGLPAFSPFKIFFKLTPIVQSSGQRYVDNYFRCTAS